MLAIDNPEPATAIFCFVSISRFSPRLLEQGRCVRWKDTSASEAAKTTESFARLCWHPLRSFERFY